MSNADRPVFFFFFFFFLTVAKTSTRDLNFVLVLLGYTYLRRDTGTGDKLALFCRCPVQLAVQCCCPS